MEKESIFTTRSACWQCWRISSSILFRFHQTWKIHLSISNVQLTIILCCWCSLASDIINLLCRLRTFLSLTALFGIWFNERFDNCRVSPDVTVRADKDRSVSSSSSPLKKAVRLSNKASGAFGQIWLCVLAEFLRRNNENFHVENSMKLTSVQLEEEDRSNCIEIKNVLDLDVSVLDTVL